MFWHDRLHGTTKQCKKTTCIRESTCLKCRTGGFPYYSLLALIDLQWLFLHQLLQVLTSRCPTETGCLCTSSCWSFPRSIKQSQSWKKIAKEPHVWWYSFHPSSSHHFNNISTVPSTAGKLSHLQKLSQPITYQPTYHLVINLSPPVGHHGALVDGICQFIRFHILHGFQTHAETFGLGWQ